MKGTDFFIWYGTDFPKKYMYVDILNSKIIMF